ncbi:twin-arginine translocation signal domain-containing protein, partial [Nostoc sp. NIES-2111]
MSLIHIPHPQISRRQFLQLSGISSMSLLLGGCGTPVFEDLVGVVSQPLNQKVEELIFNPQKLVPEFSLSDIQPEALIVNSFRSTPII